MTGTVLNRFQIWSATIVSDGVIHALLGWFGCTTVLYDCNVQTAQPAAGLLQLSALTVLDFRSRHPLLVHMALY